MRGVVSLHAPTGAHLNSEPRQSAARPIPKRSATCIPSRAPGCNRHRPWANLLSVVWLLFLLGQFELSAAESATAAPVIASFSPSSGPPGTLVILFGSNLLQVTSITFGGVLAPIYGGVDDGTAIQTEVPPNAVTGPIVVVTDHGSATSQSEFQVAAAPPVIERFSPTSGKAGTSVTIIGKNLVNVTGVDFNGMAAAYQNIAGLSALVPEGATTGPIRVTTRHGAFTTTSDFVVALAATPSITEFTPGSGPPGTQVTITGSNLVDVVSVTFNGAKAEFAPGFEPGQLFATVPSAATTGVIAIQTAAGSCASEGSFVVTAAGSPIITGFSTNRASPGTWILIRGGNLSRVQSVRFQGVEAAFSEISPDALSARVPYAPSGPVTVRTESGLATSPESFTVVGGAAPPEILSFAPQTGIDGTEVRIRVANLGAIRAVRFNGTETGFGGESGEIIATVPSFATTGPITIETDWGLATSREVFTTFNSGELGVLNIAEPAVVLGSRVAFHVTLTNLSSRPIENIRVLHTLASGDPGGEPLVVWQEKGPVFNMLPPGNVSILGSVTSQGEITVTNGMVVCQVPTLEAKGSVAIRLEVEPRGLETMHLLASATAGPVGAGAIYASAVRSVIVTGAVAMAVELAGQNQVEISWPIHDPQLTLQGADYPLQEAAWTEVAEPVVMVGVRNVVRLPVSRSHQFFRLVLPGGGSL